MKLPRSTTSESKAGEVKPGEKNSSCVLRTPDLGIDVCWEHPRLDSLDDAKLCVRDYWGALYLPGGFRGGVRLQQPKLVGDTRYLPTVSPEYELGWVKAGKSRDEPSFLSNLELADVCVTQFMNLIRRNHRKSS